MCRVNCKLLAALAPQALTQSPRETVFWLISVGAGSDPPRRDLACGTTWKERNPDLRATSRPWTARFSLPWLRKPDGRTEISLYPPPRSSPSLCKCL